MKQLLTFTLMALLFTACGQQESQDTDAAAGDVMKVTALLEQPEPMNDKEVVLEGTVTHVCKHGGRRVHLTDVETNEKIRVEAPEDMPAFARELEGSDIVVTGVLKETRIDAAYLDEWEAEIRQAAEEGNEEAAHDHAGQDLAEHEKEMDQMEGEMPEGEVAEGEMAEGEHVAAGNDGHVEPQGMDAVNAMRKELEESGKPYLSQWHIECITYKMKDGSEAPVAKQPTADEGAEEHAH